MKQWTARLAVIGVAVAAVGFAAGCGDDDDDDSTTTQAESTAAETTAAEPATIVAAAQATPDLSTLVTAVTAAGLAETLSGPGPYTVFAPTNAAFEALPPGTLDDLLKPANKKQLADVLSYHVVDGEFLSTDLQSGPVPTLLGPDVEVAVKGATVTVNGVPVEMADVQTGNGVVHVIGEVLTPPSN